MADTLTETEADVRAAVAKWMQENLRPDQHAAALQLARVRSRRKRNRMVLAARAQRNATSQGE